MYKLNLIWSACRLGLPLLVSKHCNLVALDNKVLQLKLLEFKGLAKGCEEFCSSSTTFVNTSPREHTCGGRSCKIASSVNISNKEEMSRRLKASYNCFTMPMFSSSFIVLYIY